MDPTVSNALLTLTEALANPVIVVLPAANVVIPDAAPAIVKLEPPCMVLVALTNPVIVVLPAANVVIPDTAPEKEPVFALITQRWVVDPRAVPAVLDNGYEPDVFAMKFVVVNEAALIVPV